MAWTTIRNSKLKNRNKSTTKSLARKEDIQMSSQALTLTIDVCLAL